ncbi:hypothetical protein Tco_1464826 [Tanacetum coccineum]
MTRVSLGRLRYDVVAKSLTPSLERSRRHRFIPATSSPRSPLDVDAGTDEIASDGNVDPYYEARVSNIIGDVLERDLLPIVPGPYYIPNPYDEGSVFESPLYTKDDWKEIHGVNLGLQKKELYKDPKLITHGIMLNARYDHSLRSVERLSKKLTAHLRVLKYKFKTTEQKLSSCDKKHRKYRNERDALAIEKSKIKFLKTGEFNQAFTGVLNTKINVGVERGLRMDRTDEEFRELS